MGFKFGSFKLAFMMHECGVTLCIGLRNNVTSKVLPWRSPRTFADEFLLLRRPAPVYIKDAVLPITSLPQAQGTHSWADLTQN